MSLGSLFASSALPAHKRFCLVIPVTLSLPAGPLKTTAMIDSGAACSFINQNLVDDHNIETYELDKPVNLTLGDGFPSIAGPVTQSAPIAMSISYAHHEAIDLKVTALGRNNVILGMDWLTIHNPTINWRKHMVHFLSTYCTSTCITEDPLDVAMSFWSIQDSVQEHSLADFDLHQLALDTIENKAYPENYLSFLESMLSNNLAMNNLSLNNPALNNPALNNPETPVPVILPKEYQDLAHVFKEREPGTLPPHRPFDHSITLEPGSKAPYGPLYTLSQKELDALKEYIELWPRVQG